ncbi:hypothetical protein, partial [Roseiarcus sp.]|uniref:hypothetical protein n=2 Tax=Roseiarcus sp. TaxID=1969460 RepID=UPI003C35A5F6
GSRRRRAEASIMVRSVLLGAASLALVFATSAPASAQTATTPAKHPDYHHAKHKKPKELAEGRQITVHKATPSWLTLGGVASPSETSTNNYVLDTFAPPTPIQGTFLQGRMIVPDNRFQGAGVPLLRF